MEGMDRAGARSIDGMQPSLRQAGIRAACLATLLVVLAACGGSGSTTASNATSSAATSSDAIPVAGQPPVDGVPWYLAIGDSITFGFSIDPARAGSNSAWALQLQGMLARRGEPWRLYDVACSGERTDTYYTLCPGRRAVPFLLTQSQHDAAMAAIAAHKADLKLILVDLGSNDLLQALRRGEGPAQVATQLRANLTRIVTELERAAPGVPVVLCNYYNPLANLDPPTVAQVGLINDLVAAVASDNHALRADFHGAVNTVASGNDAHLCDYIDCAHGDIHPTVLGHTRLAQAALAVIP